MFAKTQIAMATTLLLGGAGLVAAPALAQQSASEQRIEITGSAIKRIDAETAVPVTVLKADELRAQGLTTVEQIVDTLTAMQANVGTSQTVGASYGGASFADLRGIGANKTLILLNGRRIANNAFDASAPDLNMIPVAALERVELLRDGASALYGTDAVGGVINFITRRDYTGGTVMLGHDAPEHPGGKAYNANIGFGFGDLAQNGFNVFGFVDFQKQDNIKDFKSAFLPIMLPVIIVCGLILPANFSTAAVLFATCLFLMFIGRVNIKYILGLIGAEGLDECRVCDHSIVTLPKLRPLYELN